MSVRKQGGFVLGELLLAMVVVGVFMAMTVTLLADQQRELAAVQVGSKADSFAAAAQAYYEANSTAMKAAMADGTGADEHCVIKADPADGTGGTTTNDTTLKTCALDATWLQWKKALPLGYVAKSGRDSRWVAIFREIYDGTDPTGNVEMLVVMAKDGATFDAPLLGGQLTKAANAAGAGGGYVPGQEMGPCVAKRATSTYQACGAASAWKVNLADFISAAELAEFGAALPN